MDFSLLTLLHVAVLLAVALRLFSRRNTNGSALAWLLLVILVPVVGVVMYLLISIKEIRLNQRQANFIDSVTHELKSPIASLKLYLETLQMRSVPEHQREQFYGVMGDELERLDHLITQLLEVGRLGQIEAGVNTRLNGWPAGVPCQRFDPHLAMCNA